ncbi:type IV pilin-like G/H family protein [Microcoleus sp. A003_D6]|uniref:type IV pilin-like G/H family protein n=1 Tax=Microcoleus sp. A003_D6 TaxID=3055266 RepID=UPI002FD79CDE
MSQQSYNSDSNLPINAGCGCLVILIVLLSTIGILILPELLTSNTKAKQTEAKQYIRAIDKAQQVQFAKKGSFSNSVEALNLGIKTETKNYKYSISTTKQATFSYGVSQESKLKSYIGAVFVLPAKKVDTKAAKDKITTASILCEADSPGTLKPAEPIYQSGKVACAKGTKDLKI